MDWVAGADLMDGEVTRALIVPAIIVAAASRRAACRLAVKVTPRSAST